MSAQQKAFNDALRRAAAGVPLYDLAWFFAEWKRRYQ